MFQHLNANASWLQVETARDLQTYPKVPTRSANILRVRWGDSGLSSEVALNGLSNVYTYNVALGTAEEKVLAYAHWLQLEGRVWIQCSQGLRKVALLVAKAYIYISIYMASSHAVMSC